MKVPETVTRVKICGITTAGDAELAIACGADALGFIFVPGTPRYVGDRKEAAELPTRLSPFVQTVAVVQDLGRIPEGAARCELLQAYHADPESAARTARRWIYALRVQNAAGLQESVRQAAALAPTALLLDSYTRGHLGGTGATFDWEILRTERTGIALPIVLAGGLTPGNVGEAIELLRPYAVDVSSGVEASPGRKDPKKVRDFMQAVRDADRRTQGEL